MLSPVTTSLAAAAELPPAVEDGAGSAARAPARPRAAGVILPPVLPSGKVVQAAAKATRPAPAPRAGAPAPGYATGVAAALAATVSKPSAAASKATSSGSKATSTAKKKPGPLAFLDDPKLSVEEKLLQLLAYLNDKWNKDLDKKMKELKTEGGSGSTGSGSSSGSAKSSVTGGLLGKLVSVAKDAVPGLGAGLDLLSTPGVKSALSSVAGPGLAALATAMGMPELAPLALEYGPEIVDAAAAAAKAPGASSGGAPKATSSSGSSSGSATADGIGSDRDAQLKLMEIQRIMDQQKEMFSLTSNLLRTGHDARMAVIQNLR